MEPARDYQTGWSEDPPDAAQWWHDLDAAAQLDGSTGRLSTWTTWTPTPAAILSSGPRTPTWTPAHGTTPTPPTPSG